METEAQVPVLRHHAIAEPHHAVQAEWAAKPIADRLRVLRRIRHLLAERSTLLVDAISKDLARTRADSLAAEVLPLLEACKFLEREAAYILASHTLGRRGLPLWLNGIDATTERVPLGLILIIAPSNYPLFLPGVQALQALAAGNAIVWKPGRGGRDVAEEFSAICIEAGVKPGLFRITDESIEAASTEIEAHPDKIIFTGSVTAGRAIQHRAAEHSIPVIAELSGCDAAFLLPSANAERVIDALCFGMRLNGSATCMAPRRLILIGEHRQLLSDLEDRFRTMEAVFLPEPTRTQISLLFKDAETLGADIRGQLGDVYIKPILVLHGSPAMQLANADIFAPIITVLQAADEGEALSIENQCHYGLTASIFGDESQARKLATKLKVGTVLINDLIVPTADPRVPFGGRRASGFGATRGAEGLLEMTAPRTISVRTNNTRIHLQPTTTAHEAFFSAFINLTHSGTWSKRLSGFLKLLTAARKLKP